MPNAARKRLCLTACWASALSLSACGPAPKQPEPARPAVPAAASARDTPAPVDSELHREPVAEEPERPYVPRDQDFALDEQPAPDSPELLEAARHNCCDEMPAAQVQALMRDAGSPTAPASPRAPARRARAPQPKR